MAGDLLPAWSVGDFLSESVRARQCSLGGRARLDVKELCCIVELRRMNKYNEYSFLRKMEFERLQLTRQWNPTWELRLGRIAELDVGGKREKQQMPAKALC